MHFPAEFRIIIYAFVNPQIFTSEYSADTRSAGAHRSPEIKGLTNRRFSLQPPPDHSEIGMSGQEKLKGEGAHYWRGDSARLPPCIRAQGGHARHMRFDTVDVTNLQRQISSHDFRRRRFET